MPLANQSNKETLFTKVNISRPYNLSFRESKVQGLVGIQTNTLEKLVREQMKELLDEGAKSILKKLEEYGYDHEEKRNQPKLWKHEDLNCKFVNDNKLHISLHLKSFLDEESELDLESEVNVKVLKQNLKCTIHLTMNPKDGQIEADIEGVRGLLLEISKQGSEKVKAEIKKTTGRNCSNCHVSFTPSNEIISIKVDV
eukprot:248056_1